MKKFQYILCYGSTRNLINSKILIKLFQYILCYGSTDSPNNVNIKIQDFNTSYVTVQHTLLNQKMIPKTISIHPMLRFNHWCYVIYIFHHT